MTRADRLFEQFPDYIKRFIYESGWDSLRDVQISAAESILGGENNWKGKITYYRYHIQDPISFKKSIKVTIEHGHNNNRSDDWSTTAYWYQTKQHKPFAEILPVEERMPVDENHFSFTGQVKNVSNK